MINLHLGIGKGDVEMITFESKEDFLDYITELKSFNCIWVGCQNNGEITDDAKGEIVITENLDKLIFAFKSEFIELTSDIFIYENETYKDAYDVALFMREPNPRCYESK